MTKKAHTNNIKIKNTEAATKPESDLMPSILGVEPIGSFLEDALNDLRHDPSKDFDTQFQTVPLSVRVDERIAYQLEQYSKILNRKKSDLLRSIITSGVLDVGLELMEEGLLDDAIMKLEKAGNTGAVTVAKHMLKHRSESAENN